MSITLPPAQRYLSVYNSGDTKPLPKGTQLPELLSVEQALKVDDLRNVVVLADPDRTLPVPLYLMCSLCGAYCPKKTVRLTRTGYVFCRSCVDRYPRAVVECKPSYPDLTVHRFNDPALGSPDE